MRKIIKNSGPYSGKRLKSYALWYYERYLPSKKKLTQKLLEKCDHNESLVASVLAEIHDIFIEELLIDQHLRALLDRHKTAREIRQKLSQKFFDADLIEKKIEEYTEQLSDWQVHAPFFEKEIERLIKKGKSLSVIRSTLLRKYKHFGEELDELLATHESSDSENLEKEFTHLWQKYPHETFEQKQKIAQKLVARGFRYQDVKHLL